MAAQVDYCDKKILSVIWGFRRAVDGNRALLCYYAANSRNFLQTFRDNLSVPSSVVKNPKESLLSRYHYSPHSNTEEGSSHKRKLFSPKINPLKPELNLICYLLALLGAHHFLHVSRIRVKLLTFSLVMSYIYGAPILDVSRSHTTTQHSR